MSQFCVGTPHSTDPMQKTLSSFIFSGGASSSADTSADSLIDSEICFSDDVNDLPLGYDHPEQVDEKHLTHCTDERNEATDARSVAKVCFVYIYFLLC